MDADVPVMAGYLNISSQSGFSLNRISRKKPYQRYCLLFRSSRHGIERLEICESKDDKNPKIITLENCVKISQEGSPANNIQIVKKTGVLTLNTLSDDDLKVWINALQSVAFRDKNIPDTAIEEDNDLYCSSFGDGLFIVTLIESDASKRSRIDPKLYMLNLSGIELQLKSTDDHNVIIANWPYRYIRKYGYRDGKFTFEAGRKCSTGEGVFTLDHSSPQEIFRYMSAKMKSMKKLIRTDSTECGENQLIIAASMEAGSRSPLPPSNPHLTEFEINSTNSSFIGIGNNNELSTNSNNEHSKTSIKQHVAMIAPLKPPRNLTQFNEKRKNSSLTLNLEPIQCCHTNVETKYKNYDPVTISTSIDPNKTIGSTVILKPLSPEPLRTIGSPPDLPLRNDLNQERNYESISPITDAWKTLGVGVVKHTENCDTVWQKIYIPNEHLCSPKVIDIDIGEGGNLTTSINDDSYDRLNFLVPNNHNINGYKTVLSVASSTKKSINHPNDYELIANPEANQKISDSCFQAGGFNKTDQSVDDSLNSFSDCNEVGNKYTMNYSIVSKPKRV